MLNNYFTTTIDFDSVIKTVKKEESDGLLSLEVNLAGTKKANIKTWLQDGILYVEADDNKYYHPIGNKWKPVNADYQDGILTVNFKNKNKKVEINID